MANPDFDETLGTAIAKIAHDWSAAQGTEPNQWVGANNFSALEELRRSLDELKSLQVASLLKYYDAKGDHGFAHKFNEMRTSRASTATCVMSLIACGHWADMAASEFANDLAQKLLKEPWTSADLPLNNPFTVAWILDTVTHLQTVGQFKWNPKTKKRDHSGPLVLDEESQKRLVDAENELIGSLSGGVDQGGTKTKGAARIQDYDPSSYVTQLVLRTLQRRKNTLLPADISDEALRWASREMLRQIALVTSDSKVADIYALIYSMLIVSGLSKEEETSPETKRLYQTVLKLLFDRQRPDGTWELSRPLFHYPKVGDAHCYEYEMLVQLLEQKELWVDLLPFLPKLAKAANALQTSAFLLGEGSRAWASGHHPQLKGPESWSTASVFHFVHALDRFVAEAIRRTLYDYLDKPFPPEKEAKAIFAEDILDSEIEYNKATRSLRSVLLDWFVQPIKDKVQLVTDGQPLPKGTVTSAIFFGPPGTAKTTLANEIAEYLGWPILSIDPSHLVRTGMDKVQAEANTVFSMLAAAERLVVLFDEFDELVRDRSLRDTEAVSRFLTTAMLPKLSLINERRRIVYVLATNHIENFDFAISRSGRFDRLLQIMPPTTSAKLESRTDVADKLEELGLFKGGRLVEAGLDAKIADLTLPEFKVAASRLLAANDKAEAIAIVKDEHSRGTMQRLINEKTKAASRWGDRCRQQKRYIR